MGKVSLYDLSKKQQDLVLSWRSLDVPPPGSTIKYMIQAGQPSNGKIYDYDFITEVKPHDYELTEIEAEIILRTSNMGYGQGVVNVIYRIPTWMSGKSYKSLIYGKDNIDSIGTAI